MSTVKLVYGEGAVPSRVMIIGEAPDADDEQEGRPFVGAAGALIDSALEQAGVDRRFVYITNVVKVRPPDNRPPTADEVVSWYGLLSKEIQAVRPSIILTMGKTATYCLLPIIGDVAMRELVGMSQPLTITQHQCTVVPMYHPVDILKDQTKQTEWLSAMAMHLQRAL